MRKCLSRRMRDFWIYAQEWYSWIFDENQAEEPPHWFSQIHCCVCKMWKASNSEISIEMKQSGSCNFISTGSVLLMLTVMGGPLSLLFCLYSGLRQPQLFKTALHNHGFCGHKSLLGSQQAEIKVWEVHWAYRKAGLLCWDPWAAVQGVRTHGR